jgi:hypothetical protein
LDALRSKLLLGTAKIVGDFEKKIAELNQTIEGLENSRNGWQRDAETYSKAVGYWRKKCNELFVKGTASQREIGLERDVGILGETVKVLQDKLKEKGSVECCCPEVGDEVYFFSVDNEGKPILKGQWTKKKTEVEKVCEDGFWGYGRDKRFFRDVGKTWKW